MKLLKNHREAIIMQRSDMIVAFQYRQKNDRNSVISVAVKLAVK